MATVQLQTINRLIEIENQVHYDEPPPDGQEPFVIVERDSAILLSAPHGARTYRNNKKEIWHEEDEYTAGMSLLLAEICQVSAIALTYQCDQYDPNFTSNDDISYKRALKRLLTLSCIQFVIDLHGAALYSPTLHPGQTIDLGLRQQNFRDVPSMNNVHVDQLENLLRTTDGKCNPECFIVERNRFPGAGEGTITSFASRQTIPDTNIHIQAIQIEMKPQIRIAHRFPRATLYKSCGPYQADLNCLAHMLEALIEFIEYLKTTRIDELCPTVKN